MRLDAMTVDDFAKLVSRAQTCEPDAQYLVVVAYEEGRLVVRDTAAAASWMRKSAEQEYVPAQAAMGELYITGITDRGPIPQRVEAEKWLKLAARQGDADAQFWLGIAHQRGWFGGFDDREALKWIRKAAVQGLPDAQFRLGQMYENGEGVPESETAAASWYRKAADHVPQWLGGVWQAEGELSYLYRNGRLPKDDVQAYMWFAIVDSSMDRPVDDDLKRIARHMMKAQVAQAQRMTEDWVKRHMRAANLATSATSH